MGTELQKILLDSEIMENTCPRSFTNSVPDWCFPKSLITELRERKKAEFLLPWGVAVDNMSDSCLLRGGVNKW